VTYPQFPTTLRGLGWPVKRIVKQNTIRADALSGMRLRYPLYTYPIYAYELTFNFLEQDAAYLDWATLAAFYNSVYGPANVFQFNDQNDGYATAQEFGVGDGSTTAFQLVRALGGFVEPVFMPVPGFAVFINGVSTLAFTQALGVVTFNTAPASGKALTWTGPFNWPCRFDEDSAEFDQFMSQFWSMKSCKFSTEKFP
jgi:hypothetical protein